MGSSKSQTLRVSQARDNPQFWELHLSPGPADAFQSYRWSDTGCRRSWGQRWCSPLASPPIQQPVVHWGFLEYPSNEGPVPGHRLLCLAPGRLPARPWTGHLHPPQPLQAPHPLRSGSKASLVPPEAQLHGERGIGAPGARRSGRGRSWPLHSRSSSGSPGTQGVCHPCPQARPACPSTRAHPWAVRVAMSTVSAECGIHSPSPGRPGRRNRNGSRDSGPRGWPGELGRGWVEQGPGVRPSAAPGRSAGVGLPRQGKCV